MGATGEVGEAEYAGGGACIRGVLSEYKLSGRRDDTGDEGVFETGDDGVLTLVAADASGSEWYICDRIGEPIVRDTTSEFCRASCLAN
jgi:hypothetical protein